MKTDALALAALTAAAAKARLPALREDLRLLPANDNADGSPAWMIHDPVANRFYRIGWLEFEMLSRWQADGNALLDEVHEQTPLAPDEQSLKDLLLFLERNCLVRADTRQASERLAAISAARGHRDWRWLLHNYLFIRIPLVRPDRFLARTLPHIEFIYTRGFALFMLCATLAGLWLAGRQWDGFLASVRDSFTPGGILAYALAVAAAKVMHELGHAYTATRYGVRVAHMGISLVVMFPMLYTDTSESWKLTDRRQRLAIVAAGILTEIGIAGLATLGWGLTEDGPLRSALFFLATTSWVLSVGVNASPFMRFDGYFLFSDLIDVPNLHARSGAFGRAFLRRHLLGWREPAPEALPAPLARLLTVFAFVTWAIRLGVFLGIALMVYLFFIKAVGIVLFAVEIAWFILLPVWSELRIWWRRRAETPSRRRRRALGLLAAAGGILLLPLPHGVRAPGWVHAERSMALYSPYPSQVMYLHPPGPVKAGEVVMELDSPDNRLRGLRADAATSTIWSQLKQSGVDANIADRRALLSSRLLQEMAEGASAREEVSRLVLKAPFDAMLSDLDPLSQPGVWVNAQHALGVLYDPSSWIADAYVDQNSVRHLAPGAAAKVYAADRFRPMEATVLAIDSSRVMTLPDPMLNAAHGGPIHVSADNRQEVQQAMYRVRLRLAAPPPEQRTGLVHVVIAGEPHALAADWLRTVASVLVRESGF